MHIRNILPLALALALPSALAWAPALTEETAQTVIDQAYGRTVQGAKPTYLSANLQVKEGAFEVPGAITLFDGAPTCLADWQAHPSDFATYGSRPQSLLLTGQADSLFFEAKSARNEFKSLNAQSALTEEARAARLPDGVLRADLKVSGLPSQGDRTAYIVRLKSGEQLVAPERQSYVADWKQGEDGLWSGTIVYYFNVKDKDGNQTFDPQAPAQLLIRTEARNDCAYAVGIDLGSFI